MAFLRALRRLLTVALIAWIGVTFVLVYMLPRMTAEDLPWTPLDLNARIGLATAGKIAQLDRATCRSLLDQADIAYRSLPGRRAGSCGFDDGISWQAGGRRRAIYAPAAPPLACPLAAALTVW